ncbi:MAG: HipA N-terminal domain-containing protein [Phenylobacterium sp.]|jgi:serine/threonine-protein kinase HipA|nr:HipA N-terminal domain-containing protein [Phenylobacterium sp.]
MADGLAQLEWSPEMIAADLPVSGLLYPPQPSFHPARSREFDGLHGFLSDSLPEGWGHLVVRRRLSRLGVNIGALTPLDRLALVGNGGRGALTRPATAPPPEVQSLDLDALAKESQVILAGDEGELAATLATLGGGSGGARPKIHVGFDAQGRISVSEGETTPGHEAWIVKFATPKRPGPHRPPRGGLRGHGRGRSLGDGTLSPAALPIRPRLFRHPSFDQPEPGRRLHMVSLSGAV